MHKKMYVRSRGKKIGEQKIRIPTSIVLAHVFPVIPLIVAIFIIILSPPGMKNLALNLLNDFFAPGGALLFSLISVAIFWWFLLPALYFIPIISICVFNSKFVVFFILLGIFGVVTWIWGAIHVIKSLNWEYEEGFLHSTGKYEATISSSGSLEIKEQTEYVDGNWLKFAIAGLTFPYWSLFHLWYLYLRKLVKSPEITKKQKFIKIIRPIAICAIFAIIIPLIAIVAHNVEAKTYGEEYADINIGDYIKFGNYEQDDNVSNGKEEIEWLVLDKRDGKVLVVSKYALDSQAYDVTSEDNNTWKSCSLRTWLNNNFINMAFSKVEQTKIISTVVGEDGEDTTDKIFLLGKEEATSLFSCNKARRCMPTPYAKKGTSSVYYDETTGIVWWLRSSGNYHKGTVETINEIGEMYKEMGLTEHTATAKCAIRPALWINFESNESLESKYNNAIALMDVDVVEAYEMLIALDGYKDSLEKASTIYEEYKLEKLNIANIGDFVNFGNYEQDNNNTNGKEDIEWLVLDKQDGKILIISKYGLDCKQYNTEDINITWESCSLRSWLNETFATNAFNEYEKDIISPTTITVENNAGIRSEVTDSVFILSVDEANRYFSSKSARKCAATNYAKSHGVVTSGNNCWWWLRDLGENLRSAMGVSDSNSYDISTGGDEFHSKENAVRPAMWITIKSSTDLKD